MKTRRLGVLGTFVWDTIHHPDLSAPVEQWGGLAYCLSAFAAACPSGWTAVPVARVGADLADQALRFLESLPNVALDDSLQVVPAPNNRVELRYHDRAERTERLTGGVPSWTWPELEPRVRELDALYVNHMSGREMSLGVALELRRHFRGPIYADLHSLFLEIPKDRPRRPRRLPRWRDWLRTADVVQVNEVERGLMGEAGGDPVSLPEMVEEGPLAVLLTRGAAGAAFAASDSLSAPGFWAVQRAEGCGRTIAGEIPLDFPAVEGDPTGCGDVWGSVAFAGLLEGRSLPQAGRLAHVAAAARLRHGRVDGLADAISAALHAYDRSA